MKPLHGVLALTLAIGLTMTACGSSSESKASDTKPAATETSQPADAGSTPSDPASGSSATSGPAQTSDQNAAFKSPTGNISCEITGTPNPGSVSEDGSPLQANVTCQTSSPAQRVTLTEDNKISKCSGADCLGDPAPNTPVLAYGDIKDVGMFQCRSSKAGVACVVRMASGPSTGFNISKSGIRDFDSGEWLAGGGGSGTTAPPATVPPATATPTSAPVSNPPAFKSPTGNITCSVDMSQAFCSTSSPPHAATLDSYGQLTQCSTPECVGDAGDGSLPVLGYGQQTQAGPFRCRSAKDGITCTVKTGMESSSGFRISKGGVVPV